jgi:hypothetical protein
MENPIVKSMHLLNKATKAGVCPERRFASSGAKNTSSLPDYEKKMNRHSIMADCI